MAAIVYVVAVSSRTPGQWCLGGDPVHGGLAFRSGAGLCQAKLYRGGGHFGCQLGMGIVAAPRSLSHCVRPCSACWSPRRCNVARPSGHGCTLGLRGSPFRTGVPIGPCLALPWQGLPVVLVSSITDSCRDNKLSIASCASCSLRASIARLSVVTSNLVLA